MGRSSSSGRPLGQSDYHALQLTANKRSSRGVSGSFSYTLSRQRGNLETAFQERWTPGPIQDVTQLDREAAVIGPADRTHVAKGFVVWSLPFGRGRRFANGGTALTDALVSGWTVSALVRYESGLPLAVRSSNSYAGWPYPIYANRNAAVPLERRSTVIASIPSDAAAAGNRYFNPNAFSNPAYGELGTGPGRFAELRGFGGAYEDLGIVKDIPFGRSRVQIKFELLNVFNRHYFADPDTNLGSPSFGHVTSTGWQTPRQGQIGVRFEW